ncbi:hypothetical protein AB870_03535 [Pandoraea faecigallinarum]|uniref:Tail tubular protein B n=1 Tax=Pandoraea faecigallinarum TaxID=656179 RepID=A0A0H3WS77_9BURK|nr:hypothetical protein [Pandoraea faecigallinarum]AKM29406.1 hypothetical protein AB870_03535 [Pandoraea faecigallinarum]
MAKVVSSYESVVRGVSEQIPQARHPGQHYEQVNMVSDPVRGLARRHGSVTMDERVIPGVSLSDDQKKYARQYREYSFYIEGTEYSFVYQSAERPKADNLPFCYVLNKDTGKFLNVAYADPTALEPWIYGGLSAVTTVGQYVVMASNKLGPGYSVVDDYAATSGNGVFWIRGGQYSRTYTVTVQRKSDGKTITASYTTMTSSYQGLLDTSDIPSTATDYQKQVNDRVNAYNSAVNKWIGDAARDIQPQSIATKLSQALSAAGFTEQYVIGSTLVFSGATKASGTDSGDGTLLRCVFAEVDDPSKLSSIHAPGKVVRVRPTNGADPYYMRAVADTTNAGWQTVTWKEAPAQTVTPGQVFALGVISADGRTFTLASSPTALAAATGGEVPGFAASSTGDLDSKGAVPYFFGRRISLLTVFQDRLVIVANGVVFMSRTGDYFNWFRRSMLTLADDDPIEAYALGAEDDIITRSVTYSKDLFMFGERKQYAISGRVVLTPKSVAITTSASERDSTQAQPVVIGNLLFYGKYASAPAQAGNSKFSTSVSQFQLGLFQDTPETYKVSQQLDMYLRGKPVEFAALAAPATVFLRTDGNDHGLYVYSFIDQPGTQSRVYDSWSRWAWAKTVGRIIAITVYKATLYAFTLRTRGTETWVACEQFVVDANLAAAPYLDMQRRVYDFYSNSGFLRKADAPREDVCVAATADAGNARLLGADIADVDAFVGDVLGGGDDPPAVVGAVFDSYVDITPPYVRDQNGIAIVNGRLVITRYTVSVSDTGGFEGYVTFAGNTAQVKSFNGRLVGHSNNLVGRQPVSQTVLNVAVGRANTEHRVRMASRRWLPMTITAIEWVGQFFNNSRRV